MRKTIKRLLKPVIIILVIFLATMGILKYGSSLTWSLRSVTIPKEDPFQVDAQGEVYIQPDTAEITLGIEKEGKTVAYVQEAVNKVNSEMIKNLKELGVKEEKIKTTRYSISPRYEWERNSGKRFLVGYEASASITVKTNDFEKLNQIIDKATSAGANQVDSLNFILEDEDEARAQARDIAINKAREKAEAIAKISGLDLGKLINVSVFDTDYSPVPRLYNLDMEEKSMAGGGAQIEAGETKITVNVTLSYEIK